MHKKFLWIDNLRAVATISVILLHVSSPIPGQYGSLSNYDWWVGNIYDSVVRYCVPIFLMLSGALMLSKKYDLKDFLIKRFSRIVLPFLFWSLIYIIYELLSTKDFRNTMSLIDIINFIISKLKNGASFHLWYIYTLIGLYLIFPIVNKWLSASSKKEISYYLILWGVVTLLELPFINNLKPSFDFRYFSGYLGYAILGYFLVSKINYNKKNLPVILILIGVTTTIFGTYITTKHKGMFFHGFYKYLSPNVFITSVGLFLFFKNLKHNNNTLNKVAHIISKYSYGIYLSHIFVLTLIYKLGINWSVINSMIGIPITTILCLICSLLITILINKIPFGKYISG